ncbi:hypothetical protein Nepgr_006233 [Nepenthes gracilis]|uniref:RING-type E3 ubiquitin transferase n=1 Tax=Nepenthes gracilis TaxID=150966 RepID=A0AAD3XH54_NEPGR|nr:hypothetical protein Nepgr_006233 [Nepenthes gracilis]
MADSSNPFYISQQLLHRHHNAAEDQHRVVQLLHHQTAAPIPSVFNSSSSTFESPDPLHPPPFSHHSEILPYTYSPPSPVLSPPSPDQSELEFDPKAYFDPDSHADDHFDCYYEEEDDELSFVTNLFDRTDGRNADLHLDMALSLGLDHVYDDMEDSEYFNCEFCGQSERVDESNEIDLELGLGFEGDGEFGRQSEVEETCRFDGFRVLSMDSESDSEVSEIFHYSDTDDFDANDRLSGVSDFNRLPFCWDYLGSINNERNEIDFEWEEESDIEHVDDEIEISSIVEEAGIDSMLEEAEIGIASIPEDQDFLLDQYLDTTNEGDREILIHSDTDEENEFGNNLMEAVEDLEWDTLFMESVEENLHELIGNPPASKLIVENLPVADFSHEDLLNKEIVCAICKDEISAEEMARQLPCRHFYHGNCIVLWLKIRNTCPVCRYELPTDDPEYEYGKRESIVHNSGRLPEDSTIGDDFRLLCWWIVARFRGQI